MADECKVSDEIPASAASGVDAPMDVLEVAPAPIITTGFAQTVVEREPAVFQSIAATTEQSLPQVAHFDEDRSPVLSLIQKTLDQGIVNSLMFDVSGVCDSRPWAKQVCFDWSSHTSMSIDTLSSTFQVVVKDATPLIDHRKELPVFLSGYTTGANISVGMESQVGDPLLRHTTSAFNTRLVEASQSFFSVLDKFNKGQSGAIKFRFVYDNLQGWCPSTHGFRLILETIVKTNAPLYTFKDDSVYEV